MLLGLLINLLRLALVGLLYFFIFRLVVAMWQQSGEK